MEPCPLPDSRKPTTCPTPFLRSTRAAAGFARLEFALTVIVVGVIVAFALERIAQLQGSAQSARAETLAAQSRSTTALAQARCAASAATPGPIRATLAPPTGADSRVDLPVTSCP